MNTSPKIKHRWLIALSAVGIHISIGSVYSWSVFKNPLKDQFHWEEKQLYLTFSLAIILLGLSAAFMGKWVERQGPRKAATLAAILFCSGLIGSSFAVHFGSLPLLYLTYGIIGGMGLGIGYISPVSTLVKWFPDKRGLATGLAIMGFGFASLIAGPLIVRLIDAVGIAGTFWILGSSYFVIMLLSASYLALPPDGWMPPHFQQQLDAGTKKVRQDLEQLSANEALRTPRFYFLWLMLFINGIAVISVAAPMAEEIAGLSKIAAASMVGFMGLFNGLGRIGWASLSDRIGRPLTYTIFFVIEITAFFLLPKAANPLMFQGLIFLIMTCYGGGFASIPAYIGDLFGTKQLAAIHGFVLTAWAAAGYVGPTIVAWIKDSNHNYDLPLYIFAAMFVLALIVSLLTRMEISRIQKKQALRQAVQTATA
jgi:MFS transporter, OFA family, oxalate/formate antiporter